jgi:hypothetical protein
MKYRLLLLVGVMVLLSGCGSDSAETEMAAPPVKLTEVEIASLKSEIPNLIVNEDGFTSTIKYSSAPSDKCSGHNFWIVVNTDLEGRGTSAYLVASSVDDISTSIGNPSKMTSLTGSLRHVYSDDTQENLNNVSCAGYAWAYPSKFWLSGSDVDALISSLKDESSQYRLAAETYKTGHRDVVLASSQRKSNLALLQIAKGFWDESLTPSDLK